MWLIITIILILGCLIYCLIYRLSYTSETISQKIIDASISDPILIDINKKQSVQKYRSAMTEVNQKLQKIPKRIIQTNDEDELSMGVALSIKNIRDFNPEYEHIYFNDEDCKNFIKENFSEQVYSAFSTLVPGAYRSDFFRTCYLIKYGGVYLDTGFISLRPLRELIEDDDVFICPEDNGRSHIPQNEGCRSLEKNPAKYYLHNAMIASIPNHPIMQRCLKLIIQNIETKNYSYDPLSITGPGVLGNAFHQVMGFFKIGKYSYERGSVKILRSMFDVNMGCAVISPEIDHTLVKNHPYFYTKTLTYRDEQQRHSLPYYRAYYKHRQVFGEPGRLPLVKPAKKTKTGRSYFKKFCLSMPLSEGFTTIPKHIPRVIADDYSQKIPKNIIQFIDSYQISLNMYNSIKTFLYLNPEYDYYCFVAKSLEEKNKITSELGGGIVIEPKMVCVMPFRSFLDPSTEKLMLNNQIIGFSSSYSSNKVQHLHKDGNVITDGKEHAGVPNRVIMYNKYRKD